MSHTGQITYLGHSTFRLTLPDQRVIYIDPWLEGNPLCPKNEWHPARADYLLLTHAHSDHVGAVPQLTEKFGCKVICNYDLAGVLGEHYPRGQYCGMNIGGTQELDGIMFSMTKAFHTSGFTGPKGLTYGGASAGVVIELAGLATLYHAGDTDVFGDMALIEELYQPKIVMLPIGDHFTMGPQGAAIAARYFQPHSIIPMHYATYPILTGTVEVFKRHLRPDLAEKVRPLAPGQSASWTADGLVA
ncbi:MAG: hypothetical protein HJJLKODD_02033 [Phycisphaerae bacterium]|nr:hypothetical protein [Phycisphaerae bacterium]